MFIERVPNRTSPPAILIRESYREGKSVKKRTLANISKRPLPLIAAISKLIKGAAIATPIADAVPIARKSFMASPDDPDASSVALEALPPNLHQRPEAFGIPNLRSTLVGVLEGRRAPRCWAPRLAAEPSG